MGTRGVDGVGHRVVHGGLDYSQPVLIDDRVLANIEALAPLAPLHQAHNIAAIRAFAAAAPKVRQVACFDTAFHHEQPAVAQQFALPRELTAKGVVVGGSLKEYDGIITGVPTLRANPVMQNKNKAE